MEKRRSVQVQLLQPKTPNQIASQPTLINPTKLKIKAQINDLQIFFSATFCPQVSTMPSQRKTRLALFWFPLSAMMQNNHFYRNPKSLPWDKFNQKKMLGGWIKPCLVAQEAQGRLKVAPKSILDRAQPLKAPIQPLSLRPTCVPRIPPTHLYKYIIPTHQVLFFPIILSHDTTK